MIANMQMIDLFDINMAFYLEPKVVFCEPSS